MSKNNCLGLAHYSMLIMHTTNFSFGLQDSLLILCMCYKVIWDLIVAKVLKSTCRNSSRVLFLLPYKLWNSDHFELPEFFGLSNDCVICEFSCILLHLGFHHATAFIPRSLFGLVTFSHKIGLYDVQGPIQLVKNVFIPLDL
jgi:hypothetical protein